jgi:hypothetical protein
MLNDIFSAYFSVVPYNILETIVAANLIIQFLYEFISLWDNS